MIYLVNQKLVMSFVDEMALLSHLTQQSLASINNKRLANNSVQPEESISKMEQRPTREVLANTTQNSSLLEGVSRGIRRN